MKKLKSEMENGIFRGVCCTPILSYTPFPLWSELVSVDSLKELTKP
jgi:hypothetical protein